MAINPATVTPIQIWGGIDSSLIRIDSTTYHDQLDISGHLRRIPDDLRLVSELGQGALRYGANWERIVSADGNYNWRHFDQAVESFLRYGINPIITLLHHGSGPAFTNPLHQEFPYLFADFAGAFARRYPWIEMYNPINEIGSTSRFSFLQTGGWYGEEKGDLAFIRAQINKVKAASLAMLAIREVNPNAKLIITEDVGRVKSTPKLAQQASFNQAIMTWPIDLFTGRVNDEHWMRWHAHHFGMQLDAFDEMIRDLEEVRVSPDIIGINYYVTSERFLDCNVEQYPQHLRGTNGKDNYADTEVVRRCKIGLTGIKTILKEIWETYRLPIAITEAHLGCEDVKEQIKWAYQMWKAAVELKSEDVDIRAITFWALLGLYDWDSKMTEIKGSYERGALDVSSGVPIKTEIFHFIQQLAREGQCTHPCINEKGWWEMESRLIYDE